MRHSWSLPALLLLAAVPVFAGEEMPADFRAYIEKVKAAGMTEDAESSLRTIASVEAGETVFTIDKDDQGKVVGQGFMSKYCIRPGMSEEAMAKLKEERAEVEKKAQMEVERLKPIADRDHSGFVSSEEGYRLRELYFFGRQVREVTGDEPRDGAFVAEKLGRSVAEVRKMLAEYQELGAFSPLPALTFSPEAGDSA